MYKIVMDTVGAGIIGDCDKSWNLVLSLAEIATLSPSDIQRINALKKLYQIDPKIKIEEEHGQKYLHGYCTSNQLDIWLPISKLRSSKDYVELFKGYSK